VAEGELPHPGWAPGKISKSRERPRPLSDSRESPDSLCPRCVPEIRARIIQGESDIKALLQGGPGEIKAEIVEEMEGS